MADVDAVGAADPGLPDRAALIAALREGRFVELDTELTQIEESVEVHRLPERTLDYAFRSFANSDPAIESRLDDWVAALPQSFAARFARGRYLLHLAELATDSASNANVPGEWRTMIEGLRIRAVRDIGAAIELEPSLTWAYSDLSKIALDRGDRTSVERLYEQGRTQFPNSGVIEGMRLEAVNTSTPAGMQRLSSMVDDLLARHTDDPNFLYLRGYTDIALAGRACDVGNRQKGIELATQAVRATKLPYYFYARAGIYRCASRLREAIADYDTVLERTPDFAPAYYWRGKAKNSLKQFEAALQDYDRALALDSLNPKYLRSRAWMLVILKRIDEAQADFEKALVYGKYDVAVLEGLAHVRRSKDNDHLAAADLYRQAAEMQPWRTRWFYQFGFALMMAQDCRAVEVLDRYMASCEEDGDCGEEPDWEPHPPSSLRLMLKGLRESAACTKQPSLP